MALMEVECVKCGLRSKVIDTVKAAWHTHPSTKRSYDMKPTGK